MTVRKTDQEGVSARLHEAIEGLRKDVTRVEIWATALLTFTQPVPDYRADPKYELGQPVEAGPLDQNPDQDAPQKPGGKLSK